MNVLRWMEITIWGNMTARGYHDKSVDGGLYGRVISSYMSSASKEEDSDGQRRGKEWDKKLRRTFQRFLFWILAVVKVEKGRVYWLGCWFILGIMIRLWSIQPSVKQS